MASISNTKNSDFIHETAHITVSRRVVINPRSDSCESCFHVLYPKVNSLTKKNYNKKSLVTSLFLVWAFKVKILRKIMDYFANERANFGSKYLGFCSEFVRCICIHSKGFLVSFLTTTIKFWYNQQFSFHILNYMGELEKTSNFLLWWTRTKIAQICPGWKNVKWVP